MSIPYHTAKHVVYTKRHLVGGKVFLSHHQYIAGRGIVPVQWMKHGGFMPRDLTTRSGKGFLEDIGLGMPKAKLHSAGSAILQALASRKSVGRPRRK